MLLLATPALAAKDAGTAAGTDGAVGDAGLDGGLDDGGASDASVTDGGGVTLSDLAGLDGAPTDDAGDGGLLFEPPRDTGSCGVAPRASVAGPLAVCLALVATGLLLRRKKT